MFWEGTIFLAEVVCAAALLFIAGGVPFKTAKEPVLEDAKTKEPRELKQAA